MGRASFGAGLAAVGAAIVVLWYLGNLAFFRSVGMLAAPIEYHLHLLLVIICSMAVVTYVAKTRGALEFRIQQAFVATAVVFGVFAFAILAGRLFFSRTVLVVMVPLTLLTAIGVALLRHRYMGTRIGVIAPLIRNDGGELPAGVVVNDPRQDLRRFDLLLVSLNEPVSAEWAKALSRAMLSGCKIRHVGEHIESRSGAVSLEHFELDHLPDDGLGSYGDFKRLLDVCLVLFTAPLTLPILLLGALAVIAGSGLPVFYVADRIGLGGKPFRMWKLRTMFKAHEGDTRAAVAGDARVTSIGRLLRRTRIDELPQLWNVFRGDMSIVGPRPETPALHDAYVAHHPQFAFRTLVRPGITGWAQVNAPPSASPDEARTKLLYDLYYVKNRSILLDFQILVRTFWTLAHGSGVR